MDLSIRLVSLETEVEQLRETVNDMLGVHRFGAGGQFAVQDLPRDFNPLLSADLRTPFIGVGINQPKVGTLPQVLPDVDLISTRMTNPPETGKPVIFDCQCI